MIRFKLMRVLSLCAAFFGGLGFHHARVKVPMSESYISFFAEDTTNGFPKQLWNQDD